MYLCTLQGLLLFTVLKKERVLISKENKMSSYEHVPTNVIKTVVVRRGSLCTKCWRLWLINADSADSVWWSQAEVVTFSLPFNSPADPCCTHSTQTSLTGFNGSDRAFHISSHSHGICSFLAYLPGNRDGRLVAQSLAPPVGTEFDILTVIMRPRHLLHTNKPHHCVSSDTPLKAPVRWTLQHLHQQHLWCLTFKLWLVI